MEDTLDHEENPIISRGDQRYEIMQRLAKGTELEVVDSLWLLDCFVYRLVDCVVEFVLINYKQSSRCVVLVNMVTAEDLEDEDLESEITSECEKYGPIEKLIIHHKGTQEKAGNEENKENEENEDTTKENGENVESEMQEAKETAEEKEEVKDTENKEEEKLEGKKEDEKTMKDFVCKVFILFQNFTGLLHYFNWSVLQLLCAKREYWCTK